MKNSKMTWTEVGIQVAKDKSFGAICPSCDLGKLKVFDVSPDNISDKFSRYIVCPVCDETRILTLHMKDGEHV